MTTAVIGVGAIGGPVARLLAQGGEDVVIANRTQEKAEALAAELGDNARAVSVDEAIAQADTIVLAIWFADQQTFLADHAAELAGKTLVDPSNPIAFDAAGNVSRTLPDGVSAGQRNLAALPASVHYVKAFGTLAADALAAGGGESPRVTLFYATDDEQAGALAEQLITTAGFAPYKVGGVDTALRIEVLGDLHTFGGLDGKNPTEETAASLV